MKNIDKKKLRVKITIDGDIRDYSWVKNITKEDNTIKLVYWPFPQWNPDLNRQTTRGHTVYIDIVPGMTVDYYEIFE